MTGDQGDFKDCRQDSHLTSDRVKIRGEKNPTYTSEGRDNKLTLYSKVYQHDF